MDQLSFYEAKLKYETDSWDLNEALINGADIVVVDTRPPRSYSQEHIPGAVNIPHTTMSAQSTAHLDRAKIYVTYCDGIGCSASTKGAFKLASFGFAVKELIGGLDWWRRDGNATEGQYGTPARAVGNNR